MRGDGFLINSPFLEAYGPELVGIAMIPVAISLIPNILFRKFAILLYWIAPLLFVLFETILKVREINGSISYIIETAFGILFLACAAWSAVTILPYCICRFAIRLFESSN